MTEEYKAKKLIIQLNSFLQGYNAMNSTSGE